MIPPAMAQKIAAAAIRIVAFVPHHAAMPPVKPVKILPIVPQIAAALLMEAVMRSRGMEALVWPIHIVEIPLAVWEKIATTVRAIAEHVLLQ